MGSFAEFIRWFRSATPYINVHRGKTMVLQCDGELVADRARFSDLLHDVALLSGLGIRLVLVFGTQPQIEELCGGDQQGGDFVGGLRRVDRSIIGCIRQAAGTTLIDVMTLFSMGLANSPMQNARLKVGSGNFVTGQSVGVLEGVDMGFTGTVRGVDSATISDRLDGGEIVLVPPLGYSPTGEVFDLQATEVAMEIAIALQADKLIYLMPKAVLTDQQGETVRQLTQLQAEELVAAEGLSRTENLQLFCGLNACQEGVQRVHFLRQDQEGSLLLELFSCDGVGTLLSMVCFDQIRTASVDDIGGILSLIQPLEEQGLLVSRCRETIATDIGDYTVLARDGMIIGCAAVHVDGGCAELACLAVLKDYQRVGNGEELLRCVKEQAAKGGIGSLFVLTTQTGDWFVERGFVEVGISALPVTRREFYNYQRNAKVFMLTLGG